MPVIAVVITLGALVLILNVMRWSGGGCGGGSSCGGGGGCGGGSS